MSEFQFNCQFCMQPVAATPELVGMQLNCPYCQQLITVPKPSKFAKAASTVHQPATSGAEAAATVRKNKKKPIGLYVGLGVGAVVIAAGAYFGPDLYAKFKPVALSEKIESAPTNAVPAEPPPPPELQADEVLQKVGAAYKDCSNYTAQALLAGIVDKSQISPMFKKPQEVSAKVSIRLARPDLYRVEWELEPTAAAGRKPTPIKGAAWSAGKGDFIHSGTAITRVKNEQAAVNMATGNGFLSVWLASLFFDQTNSLATILKNCAKTNEDDVNGQDCYVLTGKLGYQNVMVWVRKKDFLIAQSELFLGGTPDEALLDSLSTYQRSQTERAAKMRGDYIETYQDIQINKPLKPSDFESSFPPNAKAQPAQAKPARKKGRKSENGM